MRQIEGKHLHSAYEILGYHIEANDDSFCHEKDVVIREEYSGLQYLAIDTKTCLPGRSSLIDIGWVERFHWRSKAARVGMLRKEIEVAPRFRLAIRRRIRSLSPKAVGALMLAGRIGLPSLGK